MNVLSFVMEAGKPNSNISYFTILTISNITMEYSNLNYISDLSKECGFQNKVISKVLMF